MYQRRRTKENTRDMVEGGRATGGRAGATHCVNGHEFTEENTYWEPRGWGRACKKCRREAGRRPGARTSGQREVVREGMKVSVNLTVDVNVKDWITTFGTERGNVRQDVKDYVLYLVQGAGVFGNGEVENTITMKG